MEASPELLVAIGGILTALITGGLSWYNARHAAKKDLVNFLQGEIERLTKRIVALEQETDTKDKEYEMLRQRVFALESDNATLNQKIITLEAENVRLIAQNKELQRKVKVMEKHLKDVGMSEVMKGGEDELG